jgi:hypothetical protein
MLCLSWGVNVAPADDATASALHGLELVLPEGRWEDTTALEVNTDILADQWRAAASWSGVEGWRSGALPRDALRIDACSRNHLVDSLHREAESQKRE